MSKTGAAWRPLCAWAGVAQASAFGATGAPGVVATLLDGFGLATLIAAPGETAALARVLEERIEAAPPETPRFVMGRSAELIWAGPDQWLLRAPTRESFAALLTDLCSHAAVSDQSYARAAFRVTDWRARETLAKGFMLDLHPASFAVGDVAITSVAHVGAQIRRPVRRRFRDHGPAQHGGELLVMVRGVRRGILMRGPRAGVRLQDAVPIVTWTVLNDPPSRPQAGSRRVYAPDRRSGFFRIERIARSLRRSASRTAARRFPGDSQS